MIQSLNNDLKLKSALQVNTIDILPKFIRNKNGILKPLKIRNSEELTEILPFDERVHLLLTLSNGSLNTKEIVRKLNAKNRTIRLVLTKLEKRNLIARINGKDINSNFRYSDIWKVIEKFNIESFDALYVWFESHHYNNTTMHYALLPKTLIIDGKFIKAIGLLDAEKSKFTSKPKVVEFVNSEPQTIKLVLEFFNNLLIYNSKWKWKLVFNNRLNSRQLSIVKNFWSSEIGLDANNELKTSFMFKKIKPNKNILGSMVISYNNLLMNNIITNIQNYVKKKVILKDTKFMYAYLNGYFSGEAYVGKRQIQVASQDPAQIKFATKLLDKLDIKYGMGNKTINCPPRILISQIDSCIKLYKNNVFDIHTNKRISLIKRLLDYKNKYRFLIDSEFRNELNNELYQLNKLINKRNLSVTPGRYDT